MKIILITIVTVTCLFCACDKGIEFDNQYIRGRVFLTDSITGMRKDIPVKNKRVFLSKGDTLNYLYTAQSDSEGYFVFNLLSDENTDYLIYAYDTVAGVYYSGYVKASRGNKDVKVHIYPNSEVQNGLVLTAKDPQNSSIPLVTYKIYNNPTLALSNTSTGFILLQADSAGKGYKLNLSPGDYWVNAEKSIDSFFYQRIAKKVTINSSGFTIDTMMLFRRSPGAGFNITLVENGGAPVSGTEVRVYNNLAMAQINDPFSFVSVHISGTDGKVIRTNLAAGTYYLNAYKLSGNDTLRRLAKQVTLTASSAITDTMLLFKTSAPANGFRLQAKDSIGGILPAATFYLYNSELLALQNSASGAGSIQTIPTDNFGFGGQNNLPAGEYYVNARKQIDTVLYQRVAKKITINVTGITADSIQLRRRW